jgi:hypothetical protein
MRRLWEATGWFLALCLISLAASLAHVYLGGWSAGGARPPATRPATPSPPTPTKEPPRSLLDAPTITVPLGRFPSLRLIYDPETRGRLYAGGAWSEDGGATWASWTDPAGRHIVLLGASRARLPAIGGDGRMLFGEVLFEEPGVVSGLGSIAHAAEWRDGRWEILLEASEERPSSRLWPRMPVIGVAYLPSGDLLIARRESLLVVGRRSVPTPGAVHELLVTSAGELYAAVKDPGRFETYHAHDIGSAWRPIPDVKAVSAFGEGPDGTIYMVAQGRLGRGHGTQWMWSPRPVPLRADHLALHPGTGWLALWGEGRLGLSKDGGRTTVACRLDDVEVAWAAWDPFTTETLTILDYAGNAFRLDLASVR